MSILKKQNTKNKAKMKFKELSIFWKRTVISLIFLNIALLIGLICYIWMTIGSLIQVMF